MEIIKQPSEVWDAGNLVVDNFTMTYSGINDNNIVGGVWGTSYSDFIGPTVINSLLLGDLITTAGQTKIIEYTFSESITNFTSADIQATNGVITSITGDENKRTVKYTSNSNVAR